MKDRILTGWNIQRVVFLVIGLIITIQSILDRQVTGAIIGLYFTAMGIFRFGCAAGGCIIDNSTTESKSVNK